MYQEQWADTQHRAGANFSALSGSDKNALIWDKAGYKRLLKLASTAGAAAAIKKTQSFEYWDELPAENKLESLADYLEDVSDSCMFTKLLLTLLTVHSPALR